jgi:hypothetical protein
VGRSLVQLRAGEIPNLLDLVLELLDFVNDRLALRRNRHHLLLSAAARRLFPETPDVAGLDLRAWIGQSADTPLTILINPMRR